MNSMTEAVRGFVEKIPMGHEFGLWDLKRDVQKAYPPSKHSHADTVSRRLREARYGKGFEIICIAPRTSRYKKVKTKEALEFWKKKEKNRQKGRG